MGEIKIAVPSWLEGLGHMPTTLPGLVLFLAPHIIDFFYPGSATIAQKVIADIGGMGLMLATGDTKPPTPNQPQG